jgi:hypothetical protein
MGGFTVENNLVEAYGRNTYESTGVHLMYVKDSAVRHNEIHDGYYSGLCCGWIWGHEYQVTKNVQITDNLIYDIGQGWLSDLGGMYLLGEQEGTVIARNVIYNVTRGKGANDYGGNGLYTDAGSSFFTIEQNLIYDCAANGFNLGGYNKDHVLRNNIAAFCKLSTFDPGWGDGAADDHTCDCYNNIFYADNAPVILDLSENARFREWGNLLWDKTNGEKVFGSDGYSGNYERKIKLTLSDAEKNGFLTADGFANPLFADPENRDFSLRADSPALNGAISFEPCDFTRAGVPAEEGVGCGSIYARGAAFRKSDLSAYAEACSASRVTYGMRTLLRQGSLVLPYILLALAVLINLLSARRRKTLRPMRKILLPLTPAVMLALLAPMGYVFYVRWQPVPYGVCLAAFVLSAAAALWLTVEKPAPRLAVILVFTAASLGLTFFINNVLHAGEALALGAGQTALSAPVFAAASAYFARAKNAARPSETENRTLQEDGSDETH